MVGGTVVDSDSARDELEQWLTDAYPMAYRTAWLIVRNAADAEDAVQEAYLRIWRFRDAIPAGDGRRPWLYRVVTNACLSQLRSAKSRPASSGDSGLDTLPAGDAGDAPEISAEASALAAAVALALDALPEILRVPLILRYWTGLSEREIATAIKRRPGTVKSRLYDGRQRLSANPALASWVDTTLEGAV